MLQQTDFAEKPLGDRVRAGVAWSAASLFTTYLTGLVRHGNPGATPDPRRLWPVRHGHHGRCSRRRTNPDRTGLVAHRQQFSDDEAFTSNLNTVWTAEVVRKCLLTLLLLALVHPTAKFYGDERLFHILLFISLTPLIQGFQNIGLLILRKKVSFKKIVWLEQTTNVLTTILAIGSSLLDAQRLGSRRHSALSAP